MKEILLKLKHYTVTKSIVVWYEIKSAGRALNRESEETIEASKILMRIIKRKDVTPEEIYFLKEQSIDLGKVALIIGLQSIPGSSLAIIAVEKVIQKHGLTLFPKEHNNPLQK